MGSGNLDICLGHFGDPSVRIDDRILGAQASILVVALSAYVLAALFAERRESEARLASSNTMPLLGRGGLFFHGLSGQGCRGMG
jgi:hypothetical protein